MERTPATFRLHLNKRVAACGQYYLLLKAETVLGPDYLIVPHACSSNYCESCRRSNLLRIRRALVATMHSRRWRLVTLTFARRNISTVEQLRTLRRSFDLLSKRLRRKFPGVAYVRAIEVHKDGYPHVHLVIDHYIPVAWLQLHWKECGGGIVDIREGKRCPTCKRKPPCEHLSKPQRFTHHDAAKYLTEEIEKAYQDPHSLGVDYWCAAVRSLTVSRNLKLRSDDSPWKYAGIAKTWDDIEYLYAQEEWSARGGNRTTPTIVTRGNAAIIGSALVQR